MSLILGTLTPYTVPLSIGFDHIEVFLVDYVDPIIPLADFDVAAFVEDLGPRDPDSGQFVVITPEESALADALEPYRLEGTQ